MATSEIESDDSLHEGRTIWVLRLLTGVTIVALMLLATAAIARRELAGRGIPISVEASEVLLVVMVFAGIGAAEFSRAHVRTPLLTSRLAPARAASMRLIGTMIAACWVGWACVATAEAAIDSFIEKEYRIGVYHVPIWPARVVIPIGLLVLFIALLRSGQRSLQQLVEARRTEGGDSGH